LAVLVSRYDLPTFVRSDNASILRKSASHGSFLMSYGSELISGAVRKWLEKSPQTDRRRRIVEASLAVQCLGEVLLREPVYRFRGPLGHLATLTKNTI